MRDFRSVIYIIGMLLCIEAVAMLIPMLIDILYKNSDWLFFFFSSFITFFIGLVLYFSFRQNKKKIKVREAFFLTLISWIIIAVFASLPFVYSSSNLNYSDAFFESIREDKEPLNNANWGRLATLTGIMGRTAVEEKREQEIKDIRSNNALRQSTLVIMFLKIFILNKRDCLRTRKNGT